jgi:hypothetical protein
VTRISNAQSLYAAQIAPTEAKATPRSGVSGSSQARSSDRLALSVDAANQHMQTSLLGETGKKVQALFDKHGVELPSTEGIDWSADATAQRIFDFASSFVELHKQQNPDMDEAEAIDTYETIIRGAVDKGVGEALEMLEGGGFLEHSVDLARETQSLVHEKFDAFFAELRANLAEQNAVD